MCHTGSINRIKYILLATHFYPPVGLTIWALAYAYLLNQDFNLVSLAVMVLLGQFSIGWSNDYTDRYRDAAINRTEKPIVAGNVSANLIKWLSVIALIMGVAISFTFGLLASVLYIVALASGFMYNIKLKQTVFSIATYCISFGLLPIVITLVTQDSIPSFTVIIAFGLIGGAMYFQDVIPDMADDAKTNVKGFAHRFSHANALLICSILATLATAVALTSVNNNNVTAIIVGLTVCALILFAHLLRNRKLEQSHSASLAVSLLAIVATLASAIY